jgi:hypothetical protein
VNTYRHHEYLAQITFVALTGGTQGSAEERVELKRMAQLFHCRVLVENFAEIVLKDVLCCISCGLFK